ncbi:MAG: thioredoxin family protein [Desulfobacterales bacterium]
MMSNPHQRSGSAATVPAHEKGIIRDWVTKHSGPIDLTLVLTPDNRSGDFQLFFTEFSRISEIIRLTIRKEETGIPYVRLGEKVHFHAIPSGTELVPFLDGLDLFFANGSSIAPETFPMLEDIETPAELMLFVTGFCPYCPKMMHRILPLTAGCPLLSLTVIDGLLFPEKASEHHVTSVPALLLDNDFRWHGEVGAKEIIEAVRHRDPARMGGQTMENLLKEGGASRLAEWMVSRKNVFPALLDLLVHEKWPVRLGAMVAVEEITARDARLAQSVAEPLMALYPAASHPVKGDILYVLGLVGGKDETLPYIKEILNQNPDLELRDAALEAVEAINRKE